MEIRKAQKKDILEIMEIINQAKASLKSLNVSQWQDGYPNKDTILSDIQQEISYVLTENEKILATVAISFSNESAYSQIFSGSFRSSESYAVLHRIAVDDSKKNQGFAKHLIIYAISLCKKNKYNWIRIDTHEKNIPMQRFLKKQGFRYCGIIYLSPEHNDITKRLAYDYHIV